MAVDQPDVVDFVSRAPNGDCVLAISDHHEWSDKHDRLLVLQEKINRYVAFAEGGELVEKFPEMQGARVVLKTYFMHAPNADGVRFLELARRSVEDAGFGFEYKIIL